MCWTTMPDLYQEQFGLLTGQRFRTLFMALKSGPEVAKPPSNAALRAMKPGAYYGLCPRVEYKGARNVIRVPATE